MYMTFFHQWNTNIIFRKIIHLCDSISCKWIGSSKFTKTTQNDIIRMTPVDELVSSKAKMIGVGKKNTNVLNFLNYKP